MSVWMRTRGNFPGVAAVLGVFALGMCLSGISASAAQSGASETTDHSADHPADHSADHSATPDGKSQDSGEIPLTRLKIVITGNLTGAGTPDKPVGNASVYVRYVTGGGFLHRDKLAEMDLKTNQDGSVKVPAIPQGKIMIQVVAPGWHTYGKWYDIEKADEMISIKLDPPPHWY